MNAAHPRLRAHLGILAGLALVVSALYLRPLTYPLVSWDDANYTTENTLIRSLSWPHLKEMFTREHFYLYIPVTLASYALDYRFGGLDPAGYRRTNLALHAMNTCLVYGLVFLLAGDSLLALAVALLFGVHPVQVESVIWVAERKNVLSSFFLLSALLAYICAVKPRAGNYALIFVSWCAFMLGLLAKPNGVVLPLVLILYDLCHHRSARRWPVYLLFLLGSALIAWVTCRITGHHGLMKYYGGSLGATLLTMTVVMMKYAEILIFPLRQSFIYYFPVYSSVLNPHVLGSLLALAAAGSGLIFLWKRARDLFFWGAWGLVFLLPVLNLIPFPSLMNDRYLYLPLIGFFALLLSLLQKRAGRAVMTAAAGAMIFILALMNLHRQTAWASMETLWADTQAKSGMKSKWPFINLGMHYFRSGDYDKAIAQFEALLRIQEDSGAYEGLGLSYFKKGDDGKALDYFRKALPGAGHPEDVHNELGLVYQKQGRLEEALREFEEAVRIAPGYPKYRNNLAFALIKAGRVSEGREQFQAALRQDPDYDDALYNLGVLSFGDRDYSQAAAYFSRLLKVRPGYRHAAQAREFLEKARNSAS